MADSIDNVEGLFDAWQRAREMTPEDLCRDAPHLLVPLRQMIARAKAAFLPEVSADSVDAFGPPEDDSLRKLRDWINDAGRRGDKLRSPALANALKELASAIQLDEQEIPPAEPVANPGAPGPGELLAGRYQLLDWIGEGGMGVVHRARDVHVDQVVAVKLIRRERFTSPQSGQFGEEVRMITRLNHIGGIVKVFDCQLSGNTPFVVMQYIDGWQLESFIRHQCPSREERVRLAVDVCETLHAIHEGGILHRDIKPANILIPRTQVGGRWNPVVADFGLAIDPLAEDVNPDAPAGTLAFISPEQLFEPDQLTRRSDVYSMGVMAYWLLSERLPYQLTREMLPELRQRGEFPAPAELAAERAEAGVMVGVPPALAAAVLRALRREPMERYQSAREFGDALRQWLRDSGGPRPEPAPRPAPAEARAAPRKARGLAAILLAEIADRPALRSSLGVERFTELARELTRQLAALQGGEVFGHVADRASVRFDSYSDAVSAALDIQWKAGEQSAGTALRIGIDAGEVLQPGEGGAAVLEGAAVERARALMDAAFPGQILLSRAVYEEARLFSIEARGGAAAVQWLAHGPYRFDALGEEVDVYEVGAAPRAPLKPPSDKTGVRRTNRNGQEEVDPWRPAVGRSVPGRGGWQLVKSLGAGGFGDVWLAAHGMSRQQRVFKFCFDAERLRSFKREIRLFKLLNRDLGPRRDMAVLFEAQLEAPPYFLESEYAELGNLREWAESCGGLTAIALSVRLSIFARIVDAVEAAHGAAVLHQDIKPSNVLMFRGDDGNPRPRLADFGIGILTDPSRLTTAYTTSTGINVSSSHRAGTRMYQPPETMTGEAFTAQGDVYALGVLLYQLVIGSLDRPLAIGWERDVEDELLRADIAMCVDGIPSRRLQTAGELAQRVRTLDARRSKLAQERSVLEEERQRDQQRRVEEAVRSQRASLFEAEARATETRERLVRLTVSNGVVQMVRGDLAGALLWFVEALQLEGGDPEAGAVHRVRIASLLRMCPKLLEIGFLPEAVSAAVIAGVFPSQVIAGTKDGRVFVMDLAKKMPFTELRVTGAAVSALAVRRAEKLLAIASDDGAARLWNMQSNALAAPLMRHKQAISGLEFSPDGKSLVTWSVDHAATLWKTATAERIGMPLLHGKAVTCASFSRDGQYLLTASTDKTARLWNAERGDVFGRVIPLSAAPTYAVFSRDGTRCAAVTSDGSLHVWSAVNAQPELVLKAHSQAIQRVQFLRDDRQVMIASHDECLRVIDVPAGTTATTIRTSGIPLDFCLTPNDERVVVKTNQANLQSFETQTGRPLSPPLPHESPIRAVGLVHNGEYPVSVTRAGVVRLWDMLPLGLGAGFWWHNSAVTMVGWGNGGAMVVSCSLDGTARVYVPNPRGKFESQFTFAQRFATLDAAVSPDGRRIAVATADDCVIVLALDGKERPQDVMGVIIKESVADQRDSVKLPHAGPVNSVCWSRDGARLLTASDDGTAVVWDISRPGRKVRTWMHESEVIEAAFSQDDGRVITLAADRCCRSWPVPKEADVTTRDLLRRYSLVMDDSTVGNSWPNVAQVIVPHAGTTVLVATLNGVIHMLGSEWGPRGAAGEDHPRVYTGHTGLQGLAVDASISVAATYGDDGEVRTWDLARKSALGRPPPFSQGVTAVAVSPDGKLFAVGCFDGGLHVLDVRTGEPVMPAHPLNHPITCLEFHPLGGKLVVGTGNGTVVVRDIPTDDRPVERIVRQVQVLSGHRLDARGNVVALDEHEIRKQCDASI